MRWVAPIGSAAELQASASAFADERERGVAFTDNSTTGGDLALRAVGRGSWGWTLLGFGQLREFRSGFAAVDSARVTVRQTSLQHHVPARGLGWSAEVRPPMTHNIALRFGGDGRNNRGRSEEFTNYVAGAPTRERTSGGSSDTLGVFGEASGTAPAFRWSAGGRVDRWQINSGSLRERLLSTNALLLDQTFPSRKGTQPTGRIAAGLAVGQVDLRTAAYAAWRLPTLNELFRPFRVGSDAVAANPLLKPERLRGMEAGLDWRFEGVKASATAFLNRLLDPVVNSTVAIGPGVFPQVGFVATGGVFRERRNAGTLRVRGVEAQVEAQRGPWLAATSASWNDARLTAGELSGRRPAQTPALTATASLGWQKAEREMRLVLRHSSAQFEDDANRIRLPAATTLDAFAAWPVARGMSLTLRAENLLDEQVVAARSSDGLTERATPRSLRLGLRFGAR
jgi:outer membrane receptor protein involved in Fe transport